MTTTDIDDAAVSIDSQTLKNEKTQIRTIMLCTLLAGLCSIIYQLLIATTTAYFLGNSVQQFSITIGLFMASLGGGAWFSRLIKKDVLFLFLKTEILLALIGGLSVPLLYLVFALDTYFYAFYILLTLAVGFLVGLEIPCLIRLLEQYKSLRLNISNVMSLDYLGALVATLAFPFILLPLFGIFRSSVIFGVVNIGIAFIILIIFHQRFTKAAKVKFWALSLTALFILLGSLIGAGKILHLWDNHIYQGHIVYAAETPYQQIILSRHRNDIRLYLNGNLQFSSRDEYRYHESLIHVPLWHHPNPQNILLLGAGDGLALREIFKYDTIESVTLVDLDPAITQLASTSPYLRDLNNNSLSDPRLTIIHDDAMRFLHENAQKYDIIICDLPDPSTIELVRLYSREFYQNIRLHLAEDGLMVTQATSPLFAHDAYWIIQNSLTAAGFATVQPYHINVPSFGEWGFIMASMRPTLTLENPQRINNLRFITPEIIPSLFTLPTDLQANGETRINSLDRPHLLYAYNQGWREWE